MIATCAPLAPSHPHCHYVSSSSSSSSANELKRKVFSPATQAGARVGPAPAQAQSANMSTQQQHHPVQGPQLDDTRKAAAVDGRSSGCLKDSSRSNLPQPSPKRRKKMPDPTQVADWFAKMVCYIWFAPAQATRPITPVQQSPLASYAPLHQASCDGSPQSAAYSAFADAPRPSSSSGITGAGTMQSFQPVFADRQTSSAINDANARFSAELMRRGSPLDHSRAFASSSGLGAHQPKRISSMMRLKPQAKFVSFARELLSTTQLSTSVILLALLYVFRFKAMHPSVKGQEGSEFRMAIVGLMLANKFLDDNTYTNKTWSEISNIKLKDITRMEMEFWSGLEMRIHVTEREFNMWKKCLEVMTEQRSQLLIRRERELMTSRPLVSQSTAFAGSPPPRTSHSHISPTDVSAVPPHMPFGLGHWSTPLRQQAPVMSQSLHSSPLRPATADRILLPPPPLPHSASELFLQPNVFGPSPPPPPPPHSAAAAAGLAISPTSAFTLDSSTGLSSARTAWSASVSPSASSFTSAPSHGMRISASPSYDELSSTHDYSKHARRYSANLAGQETAYSSSHANAAAAQHSKRSLAAMSSDASNGFPFNGNNGYPVSPTWIMSQAKRFASTQAESSSGPSYRRLSLNTTGNGVAALSDPSRSSYEAQMRAKIAAGGVGPRHSYDLRSTRKAGPRQASPFAREPVSSRPPSSSSFSLNSGSMSNGSYVGYQPYGTPYGETYHSLFVGHDVEPPNALIAPFHAPYAREPKALTYYQLASGVSQGIPAYHIPAQHAASSSSASHHVAGLPYSTVQHNGAEAGSSALAEARAACAGPSQPASTPAAQVAPYAPSSWTTRDYSAWHQEPFNNAGTVNDWPLHLPAALIRRSPSQIL